MNYVTLGIFSFNIQGVEGSILLMLSHGLVSSALFLIVGMLYDRFKTRIIRYFSGLTQLMPLLKKQANIASLSNGLIPMRSRGHLMDLLGDWMYV